MKSVLVVRISLSFAFTALLCAVYWKTQEAPAASAFAKNDPNVIWSIGERDNSGDEFSLGSADHLTYEVAPNAKSAEWKERQDAGPHPYRVRFQLASVPASPVVLAIDGFFMGLAPKGIVITVNSKRGFFRIPMEGGRDLDQRQANTILYARAPLRIPLDPALLKAGGNELAISFDGADGTFYYDALRLEKTPAAVDDLSASIEPTIFYRESGGQLREVTRIVVQHRQPLKDFAVSLKTGDATFHRQDPGDDYDFGERVIEAEVPALAHPTPYTLTVQDRVFRGEFRPEKKWKLFAGLKIHNDIGFTDLQQNVEELDTRNIDRLLQMLPLHPFYKFNLETSWLVDNYLNSRRPERTRLLLNAAARDQVGVSGLYLNLLTGLCSGEEYYRALYFSKSLQRRYGVPMKFACLTDTPSQPWSTPSILADAGIAGFALGSNQHRGMLLQNSTLNEDSPFYWEGPDGRRVMAWFARSYAQIERIAGSHASVDRMSRSIPQFLARYRRGNYPVDAVYVYGLGGDNADIGDGSIGAIEAWNRAYAYPKIVAATDADYYAYLSKNFNGKLPVFRGDGGAYWHDAAGTSTAATVTNRDTQRLLPITEMIAAWATLFDPQIAYPASELRSAWNDVMFYDEHTWGAHNSMTQPDRQFVADQWEFKQAHVLRSHWAANNLLTRAMNRLVQYISVDGPTMFAFNPDARPRTDAIEIELEPNRELVDTATGQTVPFDVVVEQNGWRRIRFLAGPVPGLGYKAYAVRRGRAVPSANAQENGWEAESRYYRVTLDPATGAVQHLWDKELKRDLVDGSAPFHLNELVYAAGGEQQRIIRDMFPYKPTQLDVTGQTGARLIENVRTPLGQRIRIEAHAKNVPLIESEIILYEGMKRIDIRDHIRKDDIRAKEAIYFAFPFRVAPPQLMYQVHNAWVRPNDDQLPGACREWFTTQNLVVSRDSDVTIAFATPDAPLVTLTDINRGRWPTHLDISNGHVYSYLTNNYWSMNIKASQGGDIRFRYSITSRRDLDLAALGSFDSETRSGLAGYPYYDWGNVRNAVGKKILPAVQGSFFEVDATNATISAFKQAEDGNGYILRLRETAGRDGVAKLRSPLFRILAATSANGVEESQTPLAVNAGNVEIPLKANRFSTVRLQLSPYSAALAVGRR